MLDEILYIVPSNDYLYLLNSLTGPCQTYSINNQILLEKAKDGYLFELKETSSDEKFFCDYMHDLKKHHLPVKGNILFLVQGENWIEVFYINSHEFLGKFPSKFPIQSSLTEEAELKIIYHNRALREKHVKSFTDSFFPLRVQFIYDSLPILEVVEKQIESWKKIVCGTKKIYIKALDSVNNQEGENESNICYKSFSVLPNPSINSKEAQKSSHHRILNMRNDLTFLNKAKTVTDPSNNKRSYCLSTIANSNSQNKPEIQEPSNNVQSQQMQLNNSENENNVQSQQMRLNNSENFGMNIKIKFYKDQAESWKSKLDRCQTSNEELEAQIDDLKAQINVLNKNVDVLNKKVDVLNKKVEKSESNNDYLRILLDYVIKSNLDPDIVAACLSELNSNQGKI